MGWYLKLKSWGIKFCENHENCIVGDFHVGFFGVNHDLIMSWNKGHHSIIPTILKLMCRGRPFAGHASEVLSRETDPILLLKDTRRCNVRLRSVFQTDSPLGCIRHDTRAEHNAFNCGKLLLAPFSPRWVEESTAPLQCILSGLYFTSLDLCNHSGCLFFLLSHVSDWLLFIKKKTMHERISEIHDVIPLIAPILLSFNLFPVITKIKHSKNAIL